MGKETDHAAKETGCGIGASFRGAGKKTGGAFRGMGRSIERLFSWRVKMIIETKNGMSFDTERDLTAAERHILQKLFIWESLATSIDQFREKRDEAMQRGWNNSGPIETSRAMMAILADLEEKVVLRLDKDVK